MNQQPSPAFSILCIDDEQDLLEVLSDQVTRLGFNVRTATKPSEALQILEEWEQDIALIVCDFKMSEMTGFELRKLLLDQYKQIPFILISGHIGREDALKMVELKIAGFLQKPFHFKDLSELIQKETKERVATLTEEQELQQGFVADAEMLLEEMESLLLSLESNPNDAETVNRIFAIAHTIKGSSGFFKPDTIHKFTHKYEDFLSPYKNNGKPITENVISVLLKGADIIKTLIAAFKANEIKKIKLEDLLTLFQTTIATSSSTATPTQTTKTPSPQTELKAREEIRVGIEFLNQFMELSGEMTVIRNMLNKLVKTIEKEAQGNKNIAQLSELLDEMHKINGSLQDKIIEIRKDPLKNIFRPLQRTIRDLSTQLKKDLRIEFEGEDLRVDTVIADVLGSSLIHMVRNSADHGVESTEERLQTGKPAQGLIRVTAKQISEKIIVELSDDGKGLNAEILKKKIIEKGLKTEAEANAMSTQEIQGMIFESGFSTAAQITDVSGRGVGMDMVKKSIQKINGKIEIDSEVGRGTRFILNLPIPKSVMIIPSLLVRAKNEIYAIPQDSLVRLVKIDHASASSENGRIDSMEGADCLHLDGQLYPVIELSKAFDSNKALRDHAHQLSRHEGDFVLLEANNNQYALLVDEILDLEDTVVKKLAPFFKDKKMFMGATFLGDGRVSMILDAVGFSEYYKIGKHKKNKKITQKNQRLQEFLILDLEHSSRFATRLKDVFRLENFNKFDLQQSGEQPVILYRDKIMPLFCLGSLLSLDKPSIFKNSKKEIFSTLVIESEGRYFGFCLNEITDLVQTDAQMDSTIADRAGISGVMIINDQTFTILDLSELLTHPAVIKSLRQPKRDAPLAESA